MNEREYVLELWKFNAEQRLKIFNFFTAFDAFAVGGIFTAPEKEVDAGILLITGMFVVAVAKVFWLMGVRVRRLVSLQVRARSARRCRLPSFGHLAEVTGFAHGQAHASETRATSVRRCRHSARQDGCVRVPFSTCCS